LPELEYQPINTVQLGFAHETGVADLTALTPPDPPVGKTLSVRWSQPISRS
jgi:hypothetical protein